LCHPGHYFSLDNDLVDHHAKTIGIIGVGLYTALARYANRKTGECWPSIGRLAHLLDCARSTIKLYLRKLEACGLITITRRWDAEGDPTSHRYTLLDPSPEATEAVVLERGRVSADPPPEEGRLTADLPPAACQPTGGVPAAPEPSLAQPEEENQAGGGSSELGEEGTPPTGNPCPHPIEERMQFGAITVCGHCYRMVEASMAPAGDCDSAEEGQAFAVCAA